MTAHGSSAASLLVRFSIISGQTHDVEADFGAVSMRAACQTLSAPSRHQVELGFRWMRPIQLDHQWEETAEENGMGSMFRVVNSSITMLRGDGHVDRKRFLNGGAFNDCLHNCWPGPPDWWNLILYAPRPPELGFSALSGMLQTLKMTCMLGKSALGMQLQLHDCMHVGELLCSVMAMP